MSGFFEKHSTAIVVGAIGLFLFIVFIVPTIWMFRHQAEVERDLSEIMPPAGATVTQHSVSNKGTQGVIGNYYRVDLTDDQIRAYYDAELTKHGWKLKEQKTLASWDENLGEPLDTYCRGRYAAGLYFTGNRQTALGYRYALNISWGFGHCP